MITDIDLTVPLPPMVYEGLKRISLERGKSPEYLAMKAIEAFVTANRMNPDAYASPVKPGNGKE